MPPSHNTLLLLGYLNSHSLRQSLLLGILARVLQGRLGKWPQDELLYRMQWQVGVLDTAGAMGWWGVGKYAAPQGRLTPLGCGV